MGITVRKPTPQEIKEAKTWPIWQKEASSFDWSYEEEETCLILEGNAEVTAADKKKVSFGSGDWVVFPKGLRCRWVIASAIKKHYKFG